MSGYSFSLELRQALAQARSEADALDHENVDTEHVLLGIISNPANIGSSLLELHRVSPAQVRDRVESIVNRGKSTHRGALPYSTSTKRILEQAMHQAREMEDAEVNTGHLFVGVIREQKGIGAGVLAEFGFTSDETVLELAKMTRAGRSEDRPFTSDAVTMNPARAAAMLGTMLQSPRVAAVFERNAVDLSALIRDLLAERPDA